MPAYLVSRVADPILGLSTGVLAYYLWETDGRNAASRPEGSTLVELLQRRWDRMTTKATIPTTTMVSASQIQSQPQS